jgi:membrane-bound lytic murein transglycosylase D
LIDALDISADVLKQYNPALLDSVWQGNKYVPKGYTLRIPNPGAVYTEQQILAAIPKSQQYARQLPDLFHKVRSGESLSVIAQRYNTSTRELVALNNLKSRHKIRIGQQLRLPIADNVALAAAGADTYIVKFGDSLSVISARVGISEKRLITMNGLRNKNRIYVGQVLMLRPVS